jgi:CheY-like chemotaxis protein
MKDEFLATLSHELRTPLNAILGYATLINEGSPDDGEIKEFVSIIERNARVQAQLVEDLLDMNRIVSGKIQLDLKPVIVSDVVNAALNTIRPSAEAKQVRLPVAAPPCATPVLADAARLQQVIWNLLSNAVKFTPTGGSVHIDVQVRDRSVEVVIRDTGQGIAPDFLPYVFDRFRQAESGATRRHGGLGLGLSIVRHLVELHGGTVQVESAGKDCGATFSIELPAVPPSPSIAAAPTIPQAAHAEGLNLDLRGIRILTVDDELDAAVLAARILEACNAEVATASSTCEALAKLQAETFDVFISDIRMPEQDGFELLRRLRAEGGRSAAARAVALTAFARGEDRDRVLAAGFAAYLTKPFDAVHLTTTVAKLVGRTVAE